MKIFLVALCFASVISVLSILVEDGFDAVIVNSDYEGPSNLGVRQRRVTCDLLSFGGKVGDSACAANCLSMGKAGGRCNGGVCQCRKTTFGSLWDKRFG